MVADMKNYKQVHFKHYKKLILKHNVIVRYVLET